MNHTANYRAAGQSIGWRKLAALGAVTLGAVMFSSSPTAAAERVVLKYNVIQRSVAVEDLAKFAETGETSRPLRTYLRMSGEDPQAIRESLTKPVSIDAVMLDRVLNSFAGEAVLSQLSQYVYTRSGEEDEKAMRAAMVLSAREDNEITLLELMQNYPTQEVQVDGNRLGEAYEQILRISEQLEDFLNIRIF
ncbi:alpha/beta hydrolase [Phormidium tenue FACHB-886]|nr:alpha/beta hydrolase [Phormidium tenue FACHB-886]